MAIDLLKIGSFTVHGYGLMIGLGFLVACLFGQWYSKNNGLNEDYFFNIAVFTLLFGWLGGKLLFVIVNIKSFINNPAGIISSSGFVVYGGIISGIITIFIYCKLKKIDFIAYLDLLAMVAVINQGFGRIGCFLAGCCYGKETDLPFGVVFPEGCLAPAGVKLIPTQLISSVYDFLVFFIMFFAAYKMKKAGKKLANGIQSIMYLYFYGIGRFIIEFFRGDERGNVSLLSTSQFISLFIVAAGIICTVVFLKTSKKKEN